MTLENLAENNDSKLSTVKIVATRVAESLVYNNNDVTDELNKNNIDFLVNSSIKSVIESELNK